MNIRLQTELALILLLLVDTFLSQSSHMLSGCIEYLTGGNPITARNQAGISWGSGRIHHGPVTDQLVILSGFICTFQTAANF